MEKVKFISEAYQKSRNSYYKAYQRLRKSY